MPNVIYCHGLLQIFLLRNIAKLCNRLKRHVLVFKQFNQHASRTPAPVIIPA